MFNKENNRIDILEEEVIKLRQRIIDLEIKNKLCHSKDATWCIHCGDIINEDQTTSQK